METTPSDGAAISVAGICESDVTGPADSFEITVNSPVGADGDDNIFVFLNLIDDEAIDDAYNLDSAAVDRRRILLTNRTIAAAARSISQFNGYYAAITFNLEEPINARTTGALTVSFDSGVLDDAVSGVASEGDFRCNAGNNRCEYVFNGVNNVGDNSLSLVLSVSIGDPLPLQVTPSQVTMTLSGSALGYNVVGGEEQRITLSRANYLVDLADGAMPDLIEGSEPSVFTVDITPRPVVGLTVTLRFRDGSALAAFIGNQTSLIIDDADISISRRVPANSNDFPDEVTCLNGRDGPTGPPVLLCTLIVPPDSSATDLATPSGTYEPEFSIAALADDFPERNTEIQAIFLPRAPTPGPGGYVAGPNFDGFVINPDGGPDVRFVNTPDAVSEVRAAGGRVEIPLALSEPGSAFIDIRWSYTIDGVAPDDPDTAEDDAEPIPFAFVCSDDSGVPQTIALSGVCEFRVLAGHDAFTITVNTTEDSDLSDYAAAGSPTLNLQILASLRADGSPFYDIVAANDDHRVNLVAPAAAAGEVSFNIAETERTADGEALITEYWNRAVDLPFRIAPPLADADDDAAIAFIPSSEIDAAFSPLNPAGTAAAANCNSTACSLVVDDYGTDPIADFSIPITLSQADAGRLITLTASLADFDDAPGGAYTFAAPASVVISIRYPRLNLRQNGGNSAGANEGEVMNFEIVPLDENGGTGILPGIMTATVSIVFANDATSADYQLQNSGNAAINAEDSDDDFDLYEIVINPAVAASRLFQVSVATDTIAERRLSNTNAEAITLRLAQPNLSNGYQATLAAVDGLSRILGNAPAVANFVEEDSDVQAGGDGEVEIALRLSEAVAANAEPVTITWTFLDRENVFNPECDRNGIPQLSSGNNGICESVVAAGRQQATITVTSDDDSFAGDGVLTLSITVGNGYVLGTRVQHSVALFNTPDASFAATEDSTLEHGDGTTGEQVEVQLNLEGTRPSADYRIRWSFEAINADGSALSAHPFEFQCDEGVGGNVLNIASGVQTDECESVVAANSDSVNIIINSAGDSTSANIDDELVLQILDRDEYNLGATNDHRVVIVSPPIIGVAAESASSSQVKGYLATIAITLTRPAAADTTGDLTVAFATDGVLNDEVSGVVIGGDVVGDFACIERTAPLTDICTHTFAAADDGVESLSLVLSLAIGGDVDDVQMAFSGEASGFAVTESNINLTRTNYVVNFDPADADPIGNLTEGAAAADAFDLSVTPRLANDITIAFRLAAITDTPANALDAGDVVLLRTSDDAAVTCTDATGTEANQILDCTLIALGVDGLDVAAAPTGTSEHEFSIAATDDSDPDGIGVQAGPIAGVGYGISATAPDTNTDDFRIIDSASAGLPELSFAASGFQELPSNDGQLRVGLQLSSPVPAGESLAVRWTYSNESGGSSIAEAGFVIPTAIRCFTVDSGGGETDIPDTSTTNTGTCESVVSAGANSVEIILNSTDDSSAGGFMSLGLIDGVGYAIANAADVTRFVSLVDRAIAAVASPQGYNGYHAAVAFNLGQAIEADTTGTLTVSFDSGVLNNEVVAPGAPGVGNENRAGDFNCNTGNNRCEYVFNGVNNVGDTSLSLVLSLAIFGDASLSEADLLVAERVTMSFDGAARGYQVAASPITLSLSRYNPTIPQGQIQGDIVEGDAPLVFDLSITPRPPVALTVSVRFQRGAAESVIQPADLAIRRVSDNAVMACNVAGTDVPTFCRFEIPADIPATADDRIDPAAAATGTYLPQFSIEVLKDNVLELPTAPIDVEVRPDTGPGYFSDPIFGQGINSFNLIDGAPDVGFVQAGVVSQVLPDGGSVEIPLALSVRPRESLAIRWTYTIAGVRTDLSEVNPFDFVCLDALGNELDIAIPTGQCVSTVNGAATPPADTTFSIIINTVDDSQGPDAFVGRPGLNLQINPGDENNAYNIITTNDEHQVSLVDAVAAAGEVAFNIAETERTADGEALIGEYWNRAVDLPFSIAPPLPDADDDAAIAFIPSSEIDAAFSPLNPAGTAAAANCNSTACSLVVDDYGTDPIADFSIPITLSQADAGQLITLTASLADFDESGAYTFADPDSVVISIRYPRLNVRQNGGNSAGASEGDVMNFEIVPLDETGNPGILPGIMTATISITFANSATSADYELQDSGNTAINAEDSTPAFDLYEIVIDPAVAASRLFQVSVATDTIAERRLSNANAESIVIRLAQPSLSNGYQATLAAVTGLSRILGNVPVANFALESSDVQADGGRVLIDLNLSEAVAATAEPVTITWTFNDGGQAFDPVCVRNGTPQPSTGSTGTCESVVAPGRQQATITVNSTAGSDADDGEADLVLNIIAGDGYNIGTTQPTHEVALFNAPNASFDAATSNLGHGDGATTGEQVEVRLNLIGERPSADYRIRWSFAALANHPFRFACGGGVDDIDGGDTGGNCESVVRANSNFVNIVINSAGDSTSANNGNALALQILNDPAYNHPDATDDHQVVIVSPPQVGFSTAGPINVAWGDADSAPEGNLTLTLRFSPPIANTGDINTGYRVQIRGVNNDNVQPLGGFGACFNNALFAGVCNLLNSQIAVPAGRAEFTLTVRVLQPAAIGGVTISLRSDPTGEYSLQRLNERNRDAIGGDYEFSNATLNVSVINPTITRTTDSPIEIAEGESSNVLFTRSPAIGNGNGFDVGVGFEDGASAADIAAIEINETPCNLAATPITCTGDFGDAFAVLTVSIAIAADADTPQAEERIVLTLSAQNSHDVDSETGLLLATVIIPPAAPAANFAAGLSNVRTEGGRVEIPVSLGANAPVGGINVVWTYDAGASPHSFIPTCLDASDDPVTLAQSATCQTNVPAGESSFNITVSSAATSPAGAETLNLSITVGTGYAVGTTNPDHVVNIAPLAVSFASAGPTYSPHAVSGVDIVGETLRVNFSPTIPAGVTLTVQWSYQSNFGAGVLGCPITPTDDGTTSTCSRTATGTEQFFDIVFKSDITSTADNISDRLAITLVDAAGYTLDTPTVHIVEISQPDSDANFVTGTSQVSDSGGQVLIPVSLSVQVHPLAQPVTITWRYSDDNETAFEPVCFIGENPQTTGVDSGRCESVVDPGQQQATITVNSTTASDADDGVLFVNLRIVEGNGYDIGTTQPTHEVALFAAPDASFAAADSNVEANGGQALIPLSLLPGGNAAGGVPITVRWTFTDAASVFDVVCDFEGSRVDNPASGSTCESVIEAGGDSSADITVNSGATAAAAAGVLDLEIIDGNGYDLGATVSHQVNIIAPASLPTADFDQASASSDIRAEDGRVTISLSLLPAVADGAEPVTISWSFANGAAFGTNAECFDSVDGTTPILAADIADAASGNCRSVVLPNSAAVSFTITANANSAATDANLELAIIGGFGYVVGDPPPTHEVILTPLVAVSFASAGPSYSPYNSGAGAANEISKENIIGESLQVLFSQPIPAGETVNVRWSWDSDDALGVGAPVCPDEGGNPPVTTDPDTGISTCSRTAGAGEQTFGIIFKSDLNSSEANVGQVGRVAISLVDFPGYTLGDTTAHTVEISQPDSAASFGTAESGVRSDGGQIFIPVNLAIAVLPAAQPVTISWSFRDGAAFGFGPSVECVDDDGNTIDAAAVAEGNCRSVVSRNSAATIIPITANTGSSEADADLILSILPGNGYADDVAGSISAHRVTLFDAPEASFEVATSNLEHSDGTLPREQVIVQLNLGDRPNAAYRIRWSFDAGALDHPFEFQCPRVGGGGVDTITGGTGGTQAGTCESVFAAGDPGDPSVNIIINSAVDSTADDIGDNVLVLQIIDRAAYNLGAPNEHRVAIISPPIIRVAAASASPSQFKGYQVTINFALDAPAAADTTGDLIVAFTEDGILGDEVVGVSGAGDFTCDPATDRCVHTFESGDATAESLSLVLSLAVGGDLVGDNVQMAFSGTASGYAVTESQINLTRTNYNVAFANADPIADLTEGAAADTFGLVVTPALANNMTIALRLEADADTPANAFDADDVILLRTSDDANVTCTLDTSGATQILDCNLIALGDAAVDVSAAPTGTSSHGFSIGAVDDSVADGIGVQALIRSSIPNGYNAVVPNTDAFQIDDPVDVGGPIGVSAGTPQQSQVPGYRVTVTVALSRPITSADIGGQLTISVTPFALSNPSSLSDRTFQRIGPSIGSRDDPAPGETDFLCSPGQNRCQIQIGSGHVGDENLLLVLSVRITGAVSQMTMSLSTDDTEAFTIDADNALMTVTRANYTVNMVSTRSQSTPLRVVEGQNADFTLSVSPRPAVELTVSFRMRRVLDNSELGFAEIFQVVAAISFGVGNPADDIAFTIGSGVSSLTCRNLNNRPLHECRMVVAAVDGVNPAESPSGEARPEFNFEVIADVFRGESNDALASFSIAPTTGDDLIPAADRIGWERIEPGALSDYVEVGEN